MTPAGPHRCLALGLAVVHLLLCGCSSIRDSAIRGMLMDHRFRREIRPQLHDSYRQKMHNGAPLPGGGVPAPHDMDRG